MNNMTIMTETSEANKKKTDIVSANDNKTSTYKVTNVKQMTINNASVQHTRSIEINSYESSAKPMGKSTRSKKYLENNQSLDSAALTETITEHQDH